MGIRFTSSKYSFAELAEAGEDKQLVKGLLPRAAL
jgi:hypothetical protein